MPADNGRMWYGVGLDDSQFQATAKRVNRQFSRIGNTAEREGQKIDTTFRRIGAGVATYFGGRELYQFAENVAMVRGEFQQLEVAFTTMLRSKSKADKLMSDVVKFAATTPYELQDVGKGAKQLLAFQVPAEEITNRLRQIGDLAAGVGTPLNDLVSIYGKVKAKGKLQAEEMNLFLERGIPLVSELAKEYNTTEQAIYKMAEQGKVGFSDLQQVVNNLTGEGGMFFNLMEEQSKTITGQISNLSDAYAQMLNEIGQGNEGAISDAISGAKYLVENYEDVWSALKQLVGAYGAYKAAVISIAAMQNAAVAVNHTIEAEQLEKLLTVQQKEMLAKQGLTAGSQEHASAVKAEILAQKESLKVTVQQAAIEANAAREKHRVALQEAISSKALVEQRKMELSIAKLSGDAKQIEAAKTSLLNAEEKRSVAVKARKATANKLAIATSKKSTANKAVETLATQANTAASKANVRATNILTIAKTKLVQASKALKASLLSNPFAVVAASVVALGYGIYKLVTYQTDAQKAQEKLNESFKDAEKEIASESAQLDAHFGRLRAAKKGTEEYATARKAIYDKYGTYLKDLGDEKTALNDVALAYETIRDNIIEVARAKAYENSISVAADDLAEKQVELREKLKKQLSEKYEGQELEEYYWKIVPVLEGREEITEEIEQIVKQFDKERYLTGEGYTTSWTENSLQEVIRGGAKAKRVFEDVKQAAIEAYSVDNPYAEELTDSEGGKGGGKIPELQNINNVIDATRDNIARLKRDLGALRSGKIESTNYEKDIEDTTKSLSEAQKKLEILTGEKQKEENDNAEKALANLEKLTKEKASAIERLELASEQARIDAMKDGAEKSLAQNELNYKRQVLQLEQQKDDMLQKLREVERAAWEAEGGKGKFQSEITELPAKLNQAFINQAQNALVELENANANTIKELLSESNANKNDVGAILQSIAKTQGSKLDNIAKYETLKLKELAKNEQKYDAETYKKKVALIKKEAQAASRAVKEEAQKELESIPKQMLDELFSDFDLSFANLDHATLGQLSNVADKLTKLSLNRGELIKLGLTEEQIIRLENVLAQLKSEGAANIKTAQLDEVRDIFSEVGSLMSQAGDEMTRTIGQMVTSIGNLMTTLNDPNASGFKKASGIVSLVIAAGNELSKIRTQRMNEEVDAQMRINESLAEQLSLEREVNRARRERAEAERNSSAFLDPNYIDEYKAQLDIINDSEDLMNKSLSALLENGVFSADGSAKRRLFGKKSGTYSFSISQILGDYATDYAGEGWEDLLGGQGLSQLLNGGSFMDVLGGFLDPAGLFGGYADGKAQKDALKNLRNSFEKTFEAMGRTSAEMAEMSSEEWVEFFSLMQDMGHITDEGTKEMVENAKVAAEDYAKAMEEMKNIISDMAGVLGSSLGETLVTAFENGEDAALAFKSTVNDVLKSMFMQELETAFFKKYFDKLQEDMAASMEGGDNNWEDDLMKFFSDIEPAIGQAEEAMKAWDKAMEESGYEGFGSGSRSGASKGFEAMSQDSADELNGRFTAMQAHTYAISEGMKLLTANSEASLRYLSGIEQNTRSLDRLSHIEEQSKGALDKLLNIERSLDDMNTKGLKLKA